MYLIEPLYAFPACLDAVVFQGGIFLRIRLQARNCNQLVVGTLTLVVVSVKIGRSEEGEVDLTRKVTRF